MGNKAAYLIAHGATFYGTTVKGIGVTKTWKIYWATENMLPSGADYQDLGVTLSAACRNLIGKSGTGVTSADCTQVAKAVKATQMSQDPRRGSPVSVGYCPTDRPDPHARCTTRASRRAPRGSSIPAARRAR